jgi:N-acetyltransferase
MTNAQPPKTLEGKFVRLEPLTPAHEPDLYAMARQSEIWEYMVFGPFAEREAFHSWQLDLFKWVATGKAIWFTIFRQSDNCVVGMTALMSIRPADHTLEIGGTWLTPAVWRTAINTESKYLLLRYAFEQLGCHRVEIKTDSRNLRSQHAIERLGAVREALLRKHMIVRGGYQRDSIVYSIIDSEWADVKTRLEGFLNR